MSLWCSQSLQGSILGPLLFIIYLNPLTKILLSRGTSLALYADDIVVYRSISGPADIEALQSDVDKIVEWLGGAGLPLNTNKSNIVIFSRKSSRPTVTIRANNSVLPCVDSVSYLGVTVTSDLKWNKHINTTCSKSRQLLGIINRTFSGANSKTLLHLYRCLVLPTLDYCCCVWDPQAKVLIDKLESVQRLAMRMFSRHPHHPARTTPLRERRWKQKAMVCARILKGCSVIPPSAFTPHPHPSRRLHHSLPLVAPFAKTSAHQSSFFVNSVSIWNCLPDSIICAPTGNSFKRGLKALTIFNM